MAGLQLKGPLNLTGILTLNGSGDAVTAGGLDIMVESSAPAGPHHSVAPPVILPPPPAPPSDAGPNVWVVSSFNKMVQIKTSAYGERPIVALGMVMQGTIPTWPG